MKTLAFLIVTAAIVFIAGTIGCIVGEILLKLIKHLFKK
jgi:hypothetical protein